MTHNHVDHFGGIGGVMAYADTESEEFDIIGPDGFMDNAVIENVYAGNAMKRRATYMYGLAL